jgi:predicted PurR-regulated permease PerM
MPGWRILLWVVIVLAIILFLYLVRGILFPFIVSFIIAAILEPVVRKLRLRGVSRRSAVTLVTVAFFAITIGIAVGVAPSIVRQSATLRTEVSNLISNWTEESPEQNF